MNDGPVAHGDVVFEHRRLARIAVENGPILHIAIGPDLNGFYIAAQHRAVPDIAALLESHLAYNRGVGGYKGRLR